MNNQYNYMTAENKRHSSVVAEDRFAAGAAFVDGEIVVLRDAKISLLDWGFVHSDATYDVVHVWNGKFFKLDEHLDRFFRGMEKLRMTIPYGREQITAILLDCVRSTGLRDAYVEVICTRGVPPAGSRDPRECVNQFYAFVVPFTWIGTVEQRARGLRMHVSKVHRIPADSVDPTIKNYHWLDLVGGLFEAYDSNQETAVLTDGRGNVVEGPGFNLFAVINGVLVTPSHGVLEGITRRTVLDIALSLQLEVEQRDVPVSELLHADEVFVTSTAGGVIAVGWINGEAVGLGGIGRVTADISKKYWETHEDSRYSLAVYS
jgi:branched-chain amino acid aminotransferase